jgi:2-(1,2-epoxy-1,2-dihydrophenyl)acetyl-CoA isomerase
LRQQRTGIVAAIPTKGALAVPEKNDAQLLKEQRDGVLTLTFNRPERRNALSPEIYEELRETLLAAADDGAIGAIVVTGAGGAFSAGGDVARMAAGTQEQPTYEERVARLRRRAEIGELLHTMDKPTIAMIRGAAVGAGLSMALACDMRFADTTAKLRTGFLNVGLAGDHGGHYFLPRLVGMAKARELYLTSPMLDAQAALALGLLNDVKAPEALEAHVMKLALGFAQGPRTAIAYMKRNLNDGLHLPLGQLLDQESWRHVRCTDTADHREATRAYMEKRPPNFGN